MAKDRQINTFYKGLNKDLGKSVLNSEQYLDARNCRLVSDGDNESLELSNIKGNKFSFTVKNYAFCKFPQTITTEISYAGSVSIDGVLHNISSFTPTSVNDFFDHIKNFINDHYTTSHAIVSYNKTDNNNGYLITIATDATVGSIEILITFGSGSFQINWIENNQIIGYGNVRDNTYLFTTNSHDSNPSNTNGAIWKLSYDNTDDPPAPTVQLIYAHSELNFSTHYPIESYGNYETNSIKKLYWWDNNNYLRHINIGSDTYSLLIPTQLDIITKVNLTKPKLTNILSGGNFKTGVVQYAYQLYSVNGSETTFSSVSNLIHLAKESEGGANSSSYSGGDLGEDVIKSIQCIIDNIDDTFDYIKIVSIYWTSLNGLPEITIIKDIALNNNTEISFVDGHTDSLGEYTLEEFTIMGGLLINPKTCAVKNEMMFTGNIKEDYFDIADDEFDARTYRFPESNTATSYDGVSITQNNWDSALETTADCISDHTTQLYKENSTILGGEGPNISYEFKILQQDNKGILGDVAGEANYRHLYSSNTTNEHYEWTNQGLDNDNKSFGNYASPYQSGLIRGYQRGETYRFGIVFFDKYGRSSFTKWISDIKMPEVYDTNGDITYYSNGVSKYDFTTAYYDTTEDCTYFNVLYVDFNINLPSTITERISGYKIVRVKRESYDRSILGQGLLGHVIKKFGDDHYYPEYNFLNANDLLLYANITMVNFCSPEVSFNKNLSVIKDDYYQVIGSSNCYRENISTDGGAVYTSKFFSLVSRNLGNKNIETGSIVGVSKTTEYNIGDNSYVNYCNNQYYTDLGYNGTCLITKLEDYLSITPLDELYPIVNYRRNIENQYGGNKYSNRLLNEYISTGQFNTVNTDSIYSNSINVFGGDTFIAFFDYLKISADPDAPNTNRHIGFFPVETSINLPLRHDVCYSRGGTTFYLQETVEDGLSMYPDVYDSEKFTDLYLYNTVYSKEDDIIKYFPKPLNFNDEEIFSTRIYYSLPKTSGELIDSWLKILPNNFKEIESQHGELNKLQVFKNNLYAFQEHAVAILSVNKEILLQTDSPSALSLGTGGVLSRYDYLTTDSGTKHKFGVITSPNAIYYFDVSKKKFYRLTNKDEAISDIKGLKTYFYDFVSGNIQTMDNPHYSFAGSKGSINGYYDPQYNEIVMSFYDTSPWDYTITTTSVILSELTDSFVGFVDCISSQYIETDKRILTVDRTINVADNVYIQNIGDYGSFFGTVYDSTIKYLVNKGYTESKVWDSIELIHSVYDSDEIEQYKDFFSKVRCYNGYQNSDYITLIFKDSDSVLNDSTETFVTRRERGWSLQIPRNMVSQNITTIPLKSPLDSTVLTNTTRKFKERLRSKYLITDFVYDNNDNNKMILSLVQTNFRVSQR